MEEWLHRLSFVVYFFKKFRCRIISGFYFFCLLLFNNIFILLVQLYGVIMLYFFIHIWKVFDF